MSFKKLFIDRVAAGVLAIAVAYLIYKGVRQAESAKTAPEGAVVPTGAAMQLPLMVARI